MQTLYEQYRPRTWEDVVGQDKIVRQVSVLKKRGLVGRVFWIRGDSGHGKTTIARLIGEEISSGPYTEEMDAQDLKLEVVRDLETRCRYLPLEGKGHVFIVNEAHQLLKWCLGLTDVNDLGPLEHEQRNYC